MHPIILFFINGPILSEEDKAYIEALEVPVKYRNARFVVEFEKPEDADGVAGAVPHAYANYPTAEEAIAKFAAQRQAEHEEFHGSAASHGLDTPAPVVPKAKPTPKPTAPKKSASAPAWGEPAPQAKPAATDATGTGAPAADWTPNKA